MRIYTGKRTATGVEVSADGGILDIRISQKLHYHSESYEWGYSGSGPSQLALAILQDLYGDVISQSYYQDFKRDFISNADYNGFVITSIDIDIWLKKRLDAQ